MDNMVDDIDNHVDGLGRKGPAWADVALLATAFRQAVEQAHVELAEHGHPDARPAHGFALQAIGAGSTAGEVAARLGVSKQAAAKTIAALESAGYVARGNDSADRRRRLVVPTERGLDLLARSATAFEDVLRGWAHEVGECELARAFAALRAAVGDERLRVDLASWAG